MEENKKYVIFHIVCFTHFLRFSTYKESILHKGREFIANCIKELRIHIDSQNPQYEFRRLLPRDLADFTFNSLESTALSLSQIEFTPDCYGMVFEKNLSPIYVQIACKLRANKKGSRV